MASSSLLKARAVANRANPNMFYISYVGNRPDINGHIYKYGITSNIDQRIAAHKRTFKVFEVSYARSTHMKEHVERDFEKEVKAMGLHLCLPYNGKKQVELFRLDKREEETKLFDLAGQFIDQYSFGDDMEYLRLQYQMDLLKYKMTDNYRLELRLELLNNIRAMKTAA
jgi:hypothetical protein